MYKIFASDIDHTLLPEDGNINPRDIEALHRLHAAGVIVVLASGRSSLSTRRILDHVFPMEPPDYIVAFNGARLISTIDDQTIAATNLPVATIHEIRAWCREEGVTLQGYNPTEILVESENTYIENYSRAAGIGYVIVGDLCHAVEPHGGSPKLVCYDAEERLPARIQALRERARGRWTVVTSMPQFIEIVAPGTSKSGALEVLASRIGCSMDDVVAVGDNLNDTEMITNAGVGVAVANAVPQLKACADWVTSRDVTTGAVAEVVARYFPEI